jgi:hypothetical protein
VKTKGVIAFSLLAVTLCLGYAVASHWLETTAQAVLAKKLSEKPHGVTVSYEQMAINVLRREVTLTKVKANAKVTDFDSIELIADTVAVTLSPSLSQKELRPAALAFTNLSLSGMTALTASSLSITAPAYTPTGAQPFEPARLSFSGARATNLAATLSSRQVRADRLTIGALKNGVFYNISGNAAALDEGGFRLQVGQFEMDDIRLPFLLGYTGNQLGELVSWSASTSQARLDDVKIGPPDKPVLVAARILYQGLAEPMAQESILSLSSEGMVLRAEAGEHPVLQVLSRFGYKQLPLAFKAQATLDTKKDSFVLQGLEIEAPDAFGFKLMMDARSVAKTWLASSSQSILAGLMSARLASAKLIMSDYGLMQRYVNYESEKLQVEPDVYVEMRIQALRPRHSAEGTKGEQRLGQIYRAISSFLLSPGELTLDISPSRPLGWSELFVGFRGLPDFLERLDITAVNKQIPQKN